MSYNLNMIFLFIVSSIFYWYVVFLNFRLYRMEKAVGRSGNDCLLNAGVIMVVIISEQILYHSGRFNIISAMLSFGCFVILTMTTLKIISRHEQ